MLSLAAAVWFSGQAVWTAYGVARAHAYPFPSVADVAFLGYCVPAVAALLRFSRKRERGSTLLRPLVDASVISLAVLFVSWQVVFEPISDTSGTDLLEKLTSLAYPAVDVLVVSLVLALGMRRPPTERLRWLVLGGGLVVLAITDSVYVSLGSAGQTGLTGTVLASGWVTAWLLIALAPWVTGRPEKPGAVRQVDVLVDLIPFAPVTLAVVALALIPFHGHVSGPVLGLLLLAMVVARQVMIVRENVALTRHLEAEVARRTAELSGLASIVHSSRDAIIAISVDGVIESWNPGAMELFGYPPEHAVGRDLPSRIGTSGERTRLRTTLERVARGDRVDGYESDCRRSDGTVVPTAFTFAPILDGSAVTGVAVIAQGITARRAAQEELETARAEALESSQLKSDFLATMSHEIRTPMNGVIGLNDLLLGTHLDSRQRDLAQGVQSAGKSLLAIIDDILDFSKIEAGKLELESTDFDVRAVFDRVGTMLAQAAASRQVELVIACSPEIPERLRGDPGRLGQVLANLASNAVKFTHKGEVAIHAHLHEVADGHTVLRVDVRDTGVGIAPEAIGRLFDAFTQEDASTTRRFGGTGLGLAITQQLVAAMGGEIGVSSESGRGSTFWFTTRLQHATSSAPQPNQSALTLKGSRVLVVDDNSTNRLILGEQLTAWQLRVTLVEDAEAALAEIAEAAYDGDAYDVALLDMCMPGTDGLDLARLITAQEREAPMALVLLSSTYGLSQEDARSAGIHASLRKPVRSSELYDTLVNLHFQPGVGPEEPASTPTSPASAVGTDATPIRGSGRVLVVEDNEINQMVAVGILEHLGYQADLAQNGEEAVEAFSGGNPYSAVLMDCQMPVMDGWDATLAIRSLEDGQSRIPIIALTAAATERERDRCRDAGMDDFLTKPIDPEALDATLRRWIQRPRVEPVQVPATDVLDHSRLEMYRELQPGDTSLLDRVVASFLNGSPQTLAEIRAATSARIAVDVAQAAHRLKGSALNIGAPHVAAAAADLEDIAESGDLDSAPVALNRLTSELDRALTALRALQRL